MAGMSVAAAVRPRLTTSSGATPGAIAPAVAVWGVRALIPPGSNGPATTRAGGPSASGWVARTAEAPGPEEEAPTYHPANTIGTGRATASSLCKNPIGGLPVPLGTASHSQVGCAQGTSQMIPEIG